MSGKHDVEHFFWRIEKEDEARVKMTKRSSATKVTALGIFPGATVVRGIDWEWTEQDGGSGNVGHVVDVRGWGSESDKSVASVKWPNGSTNVYRVGHKGKVDLRYVNESAGGTYYKEHLPVLGKPVQSSEVFSSGEEDAKELVQGDKVKVGLDAELLKIMQDGHGGWNPKMEEVIGKVGTVFRVTERGDIRVKYEGQDTIWMFHPGALTKVQAHFEVGDHVRVLNDAAEVKRLQQGHGEWADDMALSLGMVGKVEKLYTDGDLRVDVNGSTWTFNPACVTKTEDAVSKVTAPQRVSTNDQLVELLRQLVMDGDSSSVDADDLVREAAQGHVSQVKDILRKHPGEVDRKASGKTALQVACHQGETEVVKLLLDANAFLEGTDEDGDTALHYCCFGDEVGCATMLLERGANVSPINKTGSTPLHIAVNKNHVSCVRLLSRQSGCDLDAQDAYGDTPLHDAVSKENNAVVGILLEAGAKPLTKNNRGFNCVHHAALKGNADGIEKIVHRYPALVNDKKEDGFTPLHLAALNDHQDVARVLLRSSQCDVDPTNNRGQTPLLLSVSQGHTKLIELLVGYGANVNAEDEDGDTCLHLALMRQRLSTDVGSDLPLLEQLRGALGGSSLDSNTGAAIACFLAQEGASLTYKNHKGKTPLDLCTDDRVEALIRQYALPKGSSSFSGSLRRHQRPAGLVLHTSVSVPSGVGGKTASSPRTPSSQSSSSSTLQTAPAVVPVPVAGGGGVCPVCDEEANIEFRPCGHVVMCENCSKHAKKCLQCRVQIESKVKVVKSNKCTLCDEEVAVVKFLPCSHMICCKECSKRMKRCLSCQVPIEKKTINGQEMVVTNEPRGDDRDRDRDETCCICMERPREVAFLCGHRTCRQCSDMIHECPMCRERITKRIVLYD
ncbi:E3 ubiquitin-protein ligase MIB2-like isoform X2 [Corticium candelabrum]|nr:E3 ubiquitin-protein ligase MIB2-like isoform X2 [Corticium candelabrum]